MTTCKHYVYAAMHNGKVVYVGKGTGERWKHCISGTSSSYRMNFLHFQGEDVRVRILVSGLTERAALAVEQRLIHEYSPFANMSQSDLYAIDDAVQIELDEKGLRIADLLRLEINFSFVGEEAVNTVDSEDWKTSDNSMFPDRENILPLRSRVPGWETPLKDVRTYYLDCL